MFSHIFTSVSDFDKAFNFYAAVMQGLDLELRFCDKSKPWAGWHSQNGVRPLFVICKPHNGESHQAGNGQMVAFLAKNRAVVGNVYQIALSNGGTSEGEPSLRLQYHDNYYGAYFRDLDGNKICVACHDPE